MTVDSHLRGNDEHFSTADNAGRLRTMQDSFQ